MECENTVSLWLGNFDFEEELEEYTNETYTENGDYIVSKFCQDFFQGEGPYEYDFFERFLTDEKYDNIRSLLEGCSYDTSVITSLEEKIGQNLEIAYNAVFLIYDFKYAGEIKENPKGNVKFITAVPYEKSEW